MKSKVTLKVTAGQKGEKMTELELTIKALNEGILPSFNSNEIADLLETCEPEEARKMKRKFRKLWRKERKSHLASASTAEEVKVVEAIFSLPNQRRVLVRKRLLQ